MATHKIKLKKMGDADVTFVSMVGRAANRIPFRVIKESKESGMFNLGNLGKVLKGTAAVETPEVPELVAIVVEKSELIPQITEGLKESGVDVSNVVENEDNTVSFVQKQTEEGDDLTLVRMDGNVVLVMKGFSAYSGRLNSFNDVVKAQGFYQGLGVATSAFQRTIEESLYSANNAEEVVQKVDATVSDFGEYVRALAAGLPAAAFTVTQTVDSVYKADEEAKAQENVEKGVNAKNKSKVDADGGTAPDGVSQEEWNKMTNDERAAWKLKNVKKEDGPDLTIVPDDISKLGWDALDEEGKLAHLGATVQKSETEAAPAFDMAELVQKTAEAVAAAMKPQIEALSGKVEEITAANTALQERVDSVVQKSEAISQQVSGTVVNAIADSDAPSNRVESVTKGQDTDPRSGAFDTAMIRKSANRQ